MWCRSICGIHRIVKSLWQLVIVVCTINILDTSTCVSAQLTVIPMDTTQPFPDPSNILVGSASDLALQVRCQTSSPSATVTWSRNVGVIDQGLSVFGISQEDGVLRVYPTTELSTGVNMFTCSDGSESLTVNFNRTPHLFFTEPVPAQAPVSVNVTTLCRVPDVPVARVTAVTGTGFSYCRVETERGTFRSRSVITEQEPVFTFEPEDISVQPLNGTSRAAFSCAVSASGTVQSIVWYGSGMGNGLTDGMLTSGMNGVTIYSGTSGVGLSKTSILLLENVDEGFYRCVATFDSGQVISSRNASLMFNMTSFTQESIALAPPTTLTVLVGDTLLLPCVSTGTTMPTFSRIFSGVTDSLTSGVTQLGLELASVTTTGTGVYTCTVGNSSVMTMVTVTFGLIPPNTAMFFRSSSPSFASPPEQIVTNTPTRLRCLSSIAVELIVLVNGQSVLTQFGTILLLTGVTAPGFYQCASSRNDPSADSLYTDENESIYILSAFVRNTAVSPASFATRCENNVRNITLNCTTEGNPLPRITWSQDYVANPNGVQAITGFNELAYSTLTVSTADLNLGINLFVCTASLDEPVLTDNAPSASITIQAAPVITSPPSDLTVLATGQATFTCSAEGFPAPTIAWVMVNNDRTETTLMSGGNIVIDDSGTFTVISSTLTLSMVDLTSNGGYVCVATNDLGSINATAQLTVNAPPVFLVDPITEVVVVDGDSVTLNCSVQGNPLPSIAWMVNGANGITLITDELEGFLVSNSSMPESFVQSSELVFYAAVGDSLRGNGLLVYCVAENLVMAGVESGQTVITIAGPPLSPAPITISASSRSALISWTEPFSLIPITNYLLKVSDRTSRNSIFSMESISAGVLYFNATSLLPNVQYSVSVLAVNRAGVSEEITEFFYTLEDVPTGVTQAVQTSSLELGMINVSWSPLLDNETNGVIIGYSVRYRQSSPPQTEMSANVTGGDTLSTTININPGDTYLISVAARTQVELGPYSTELSQPTIAHPPSFLSDSLTTVEAPSSSTISITLPSVQTSNTSDISHYWVVVMKLASEANFESSSSLFSDNSTFTTYSTSVPNNTPYIVAEISASNYGDSTMFVLGDGARTDNINDFPEYFRNGPLAHDTPYTAFVWAFSSTVPDGKAKRQTSTLRRQYSVFTSSSFLTPVRTSRVTMDTLSQSPVVGGTVGCVVFVVLLVTILAAVVFDRIKIKRRQEVQVNTSATRLTVVSPQQTEPVLQEEAEYEEIDRYLSETNMQDPFLYESFGAASAPESNLGSWDESRGIEFSVTQCPAYLKNVRPQEQDRDSSLYETVDISLYVPND